MINTKQRIGAIDIAKAIGIILIVISHTFTNPVVLRIVFSFHVPLFFVLSGFTYSCKSNKKSFYYKKAKRIVFPYIIFSLISIMLYWAMADVISIEGDIRIFPNIAGMLYANATTGYMMWNRPLWFLPCLFMTIIIMDCFETAICKASKNNANKFRFVFILLMFVVGVILNRIGIALPWHLESAIYLVGFSELGYLVRIRIDRAGLQNFIDVCKTKKMIVIVVFATAICIPLSFVNSQINIMGHALGMYPIISVVVSSIMSIVVIIVSMWIKHSEVLKKIGECSLTILLLHKFPILFFQKIVPVTKELLPQGESIIGVIVAAATCVITILLCMIGDYVICMIFPAMIGKEKHNKKTYS